MKDEQIVALYWDRNEDAIQQTQKKYGYYLLKVADNILANFEDSQECVNDTYLAAWNSIPTNRPNVLSTYLALVEQIRDLREKVEDNQELIIALGDIELLHSLHEAINANVEQAIEAAFSEAYTEDNLVVPRELLSDAFRMAGVA